MFIPCRRFVEGDLTHTLSPWFFYCLHNFYRLYFDSHYVSLHLPAEILYSVCFSLLLLLLFLVCYSRTLCHFFLLWMKSYIKSIMKIDKWLFAQSRECQRCPCGMHSAHTHTHQIIIIRVQGSIFALKREWSEWTSKGTPNGILNVFTTLEISKNTPTRTRTRYSTLMQCVEHEQRLGIPMCVCVCDLNIYRRKKVGELWRAAA